MLDRDTKRSVYRKASVLKTNSKGSEAASPASLHMGPLLLHPDTGEVVSDTRAGCVCAALESSNSKIFGFLFLIITECMSLV